jgi:MFS family permease
MLVQAAGHAVIGLGLAAPLLAGLVGSVLLGLGTAMVYPALLAAVGDVAHPAWRATSVGVYRFWRDLGYAVGALMAGVVAGIFGLVWAVHVAGMLTALSGLLAWAQMSETLPRIRIATDAVPLRTGAATRDSAAPQIADALRRSK